MNWLTSRIASPALLACLALAACGDKGTDLNVDLPDTTAISTNYLEVQLPASTVQLKPVETLKTDRYLIGKLTDNVSGTTEARTFFNTVATITADSLPAKYAGAVLDSVVMVLNYDKVYGSGSTPARFDVHALSSKLDERAVYNSDTPGPLGNVLAQNVVGRLNRTKQVTSTASATNPSVTTTVADPTIRLVLQRTQANGASNPALANAFFEGLFNNQLMNSGFNQAALDAQLKGLAILPSAGYNSALISFTRGVVPRVEFFFHETGLTKWHAYPIAFGPVFSSQGSNAARDPRYYTQITTDLSTGTELRALTPTSPVPSASTGELTYMQEGVGLGTAIKIDQPLLLALRSVPGLAINRAELRIPLKPYTNALFANPNGIFALEANDRYSVLERTFNFDVMQRAVQTDGANPRGVSSEAYSGAVVNSGTAAPYYSLIITNYLQAYLNNNLDGELPTNLILVPNVRRSLIREATLGLNRAVVDANHIKLYVYYSQQ